MSAWAVKLEAAFGTGPYDAAPTWVDITARMWGESSGPSVSCTRGRPGDSDKITAGTLTTTLDNTDNAFDPENTSGPFYGKLDPFTPVRISAGPPGSLTPIWSGVVDSWPLVDDYARSTMALDAIDIIGVISQTTAPETAFAATVAGLTTPPDHWWRPGSTGWTDIITGATARHTGGLVEADPVINGDERTWGQEEPDGRGETTSATAALPFEPITAGGPSKWVVASAWFRLTPNVKIPGYSAMVPIQQILRVMCTWGNPLVGTTRPQLWINLLGTQVAVYGTSRYGAAAWNMADEMNPSWDPGLFDGQVHHVMVAVQPPAGPPLAPSMMGGAGYVWIDGIESDLWPADIARFAADTAPTPAFTHLGATAENSHYIGVLDHVMTWGAHSGSITDIRSTARELFTAGRQAWAPQRLDERTGALLDAIGATTRKGTLDTSGVTTLHSYRQADPIDLIQKIEDTEQGRVWVDRTGKIAFSSRGWAWADTRAITVQATFTDDPAANWNGSALPMQPEGLVRSRDIRRIVTTAQVTSAFGRMQTVDAEPSIIKRFGRRASIHLSGLLHRSDAESRAVAEWIIQSRSKPRTRIEQISFRVDDRPDLLVPLAQVIDIGDLIEVARSGVSTKGHVSSVTHEWNAGGWVVTLALDSTRTTSTWFRWGTSKWDNNTNEGWSF